MELWSYKDGNFYVPSEDEELLLRVIVASHCRLGGHRGYITICDITKETCLWDTIDEDVKDFAQGCLACLLSESGINVPRPFGQQIYAKGVSELLHFDFLYFGESTDSMEYIQTLKDDFSCYFFLRSCAHADSETTTEVLLE